MNRFDTCCEIETAGALRSGYTTDIDGNFIVTFMVKLGHHASFIQKVARLGLEIPKVGGCCKMPIGSTYCPLGYDHDGYFCYYKVYGIPAE
jgi:hypothetical protein